jgi:hypothetical protein
LVKNKKNQTRYQRQADDSKQPRKRTVFMVASIEMPFEEIRQPGQRPANELLIGQGPNLLQQQDDDERKQAHPEKTRSALVIARHCIVGKN